MKKPDYNCVILGGGISGLTAGLTTGYPVFEAADEPGGICSSYYIRPQRNERLSQMPKDKEAYRFEIGGGHWIFGADHEVLKFIRKFTFLKEYKRRTSIYFSKKNLYVPYPIQNNLRFLKPEIAERVLGEISNRPKNFSATMEKWLMQNFGATLYELFFGPFHNLYTNGLHKKIAVQDTYKSPIDTQLIIQGASAEVPPVGYNTTFVYPEEGLNTLVQRIAEKCSISYGKCAIKIDAKNKHIYFDDKSMVPYNKLFSTLPLSKMIEIARLKVDVEPDPHTSVVVLNIGAVRGDKCPDQHWVYIPDSNSGFYRVGFYSNVDVSFLPKSLQSNNNRVSIYVERAYSGGKKPSEPEVKTYIDSVINELREWGFIKSVEALDPTWIDVAYTWSWPGSRWREIVLRLLREHSIYQLGRYGRWKFQGIAESMREGLSFKQEISD